MTTSVLIPDDLHEKLLTLAVKKRAGVDELVIQMLREATQGSGANYPIRQDGRFACFELPVDAATLDLEKIQAALHD